MARVGSTEIGRLGFGAMRLCGPSCWGPPADRDEAIRVLRRASEMGVRLIDTADAYGPAINEELVRDALWPYADDLMIATKGGMLRPGRDDWVPCGAPSYLRSACEASLRRLRVDAIELYQLHTPDPNIPFVESVGALADLQAQGKIRNIGISNVSVAQLRDAMTVVPIASVQQGFNILSQESSDVLEVAEGLGLPFLAWFPLAAGTLVGGRGPVRRVALKCGRSLAQVSLVWLLERSPALVPIPGTSSVSHLAENMATLDLLNDRDLVLQISQALRPLAGGIAARQGRNGGRRAGISEDRERQV